jgi:hypothetical protein
MKKTILFLTINIIFLATNYLLAQTCQNDIPDSGKIADTPIMVMARLLTSKLL